MKVTWNKYYLWTTADVILRKQSTYINCSLQSLFTCYHVILKHIVWKSCISDEWKSLVMILNPFIRSDRFEAVNSKTKCSESWSNPWRNLLPVLFRGKTWSFTKSRLHHRLQKYVPSYLYRHPININWNSSTLSFVADIEHGLLCKSNFTQKQLPRKDMKNKSVRNFWNYQAKMWHSSFIAKQLSAAFWL